MSTLKASRTREIVEQSEVIPNDKADEIARLIDADVSILPLAGPNQGGKAPKHDSIPGNSWTNLREKPADRNLVLSWFKRSETNFNLGIICGETSGLGTDAGLVVVDWDLQNWSGEIPPDLGLPKTSRVKTGNGFHDYYLYSDTDAVTDSKSPPLDLKSSGYVVAPPSVHKSGSTYRWLEDDKPLENVAELKDRELETIEDFIQEHQAEKGGNETETSVSTPKPPKKDAGQSEPNKSKTVESDDWKELAGREDVAVDILQKCGANVSRAGESFLCPLPGHDENNPSASLWKKEGEDGFFSLHDFHQVEGRKWIPLPDVYASCETGKQQNFSDTSGTRHVWWLRALHETGYIEKPDRMAPELPNDVNQSIRDIYEGFIYLLELRTIYDKNQELAPYSWNFIRTWCEIGSNSTVKKALKDYLYPKGYLEEVKKQGQQANLIGIGNPKDKTSTQND